MSRLGTQTVCSNDAGRCCAVLWCDVTRRRTWAGGQGHAQRVPCSTMSRTTHASASLSHSPLLALQPPPPGTRAVSRQSPAWMRLLVPRRKPNRPLCIKTRSCPGVYAASVVTKTHAPASLPLRIPTTPLLALAHAHHPPGLITPSYRPLHPPLPIPPPPSPPSYRPSAVSHNRCMHACLLHVCYMPTYSRRAWQPSHLETPPTHPNKSSLQVQSSTALPEQSAARHCPRPTPPHAPPPPKKTHTYSPRPEQSPGTVLLGCDCWCQGGNPTDSEIRLQGKKPPPPPPAAAAAAAVASLCRGQQ